MGTTYRYVNSGLNDRIKVFVDWGGDGFS